MNDSKRILVRRTDAVGDVITATAVVRELKKLHGEESHITVMTRFPDVFRNNPHVSVVVKTPQDGLLPVSDLVVDLDDSYESDPPGHLTESYFRRAFQGTHFDMVAELFPDERDRSFVDAVLTGIRRPFIAVHMRRWHHPAKNISRQVWASFFRIILQEFPNLSIVCLGGPQDLGISDPPHFHDMRGMLNLQQLRYLLDSAACFVGPDSAPFHCAGASKAPIVALLTHLLPERIMPKRCDSTLNYAIMSRQECIGCNDLQKRPLQRFVCFKNTFPCVEDFDPSAIAAPVIILLGKSYGM